MITADKERLFPRFLLNDETGAAMAAAVEKGLQIYCQVISEGIDNAINPDKMPEWRLDMLAEEYGIFYDYGADISTKRDFIRNAYLDYSKYGTAAAVERAAKAYLGKAIVLENGVNGASTAFPYINEFAIATQEDWTQEQEASVNAAAESVKNVRSVYKGLHRAYEISLDVDFSVASGAAGSPKISEKFLENFRNAFAASMKKMKWQIDGEWNGLEAINYIAKIPGYRMISDTFFSMVDFDAATGVAIEGYRTATEQKEYYKRTLNIPGNEGEFSYVFLINAYQREKWGVSR